MVTFAKVTTVALLGDLTFPEKPGKSAFRFTKSIKGMVFVFFLLLQKELKGRFYVTFCGVQKVTKNTPRVATLWTPGVRFKALHRRTFYRNCSNTCLKQLSGFEPVRDANFHQTHNRILRKIEFAVRACRRKQLFKRKVARYLCCGGNGKSV